MNRSKLKNYAPQARREFIQAVTDRSASHGLSVVGDELQITPITVQGDVAIIDGKPFPQSVADKRKRLEARIQRLEAAGKKPVDAFKQVMEAMAYTWFNRLVAIRYMEIHGYLDHGYRVLSNSDPLKSSPEIVEQAEHVDLPGLDKQKVVELKLDGTKEGELYRMLLLAQCNGLNKAMPFLFERIDDETELLLPDNLLHSDSILRKLVNEIDEADWQQVEIIGWLYQFYISDKARDVIGKVVKSEDIPAATQLFTPNWIVRYLVQNSLGRQWLATYPQSPLKVKMEFYIEPVDQAPDVQMRLKQFTPESLNPEELTLMDPACGSGHILVEAYDLLKEIYLERGYRLRDIPKLILTKNLFGLEIDDRAAQLAAFSLMMKARADDRRIFDGDTTPEVLAIQETNGLNFTGIMQAFTERRLTNEDDPKAGEFGFVTPARSPLFAVENRPTATVDDGLVSDLQSLFSTFDNAKIYGSLIKLSPSLVATFETLDERIHELRLLGDLTYSVASLVQPLLKQARLLAREYDSVVANPPYMGVQYMDRHLKALAQDHFADCKNDLYSMFVFRLRDMVRDNGHLSCVTPYIWMFTISFESFRNWLTTSFAISSLVQLEYNAFEPACVPVCAFALKKIPVELYRGVFIDLSAFKGHANQPPRTLEAIRDKNCSWRYSASAADFHAVPGNPIVFSISDSVRAVFKRFPPIGDRAKKGLSTGDNNRFIREWFEVNFAKTRPGGGNKWIPVAKGGKYRQWYGNLEEVVNWENDGEALKSFKDSSGKPRAAIRNQRVYLLPGISWNDITISGFSARYVPPGCIPMDSGPMIFGGDIYVQLCMLNSKVNELISGFLSPTFHFTVGITSRIPMIEAVTFNCEAIASELIAISKADWDALETSWEFEKSPLVGSSTNCDFISDTYAAYVGTLNSRMVKYKQLAEHNNQQFIIAYGVEDVVRPEITEEMVTLARPEQKADIKGLISYAIGCAMGRYSLDKPGLIYASTGDEGFVASQYKTFIADSDGILPVTDFDWFPDAAAHRFEEFVGVAWTNDHLEENLKFVAENLGAKSGEQSREAIRRYFANDFYKHHLQTYKRRPIYWMFSSGKLGAFQCLVYLHRYNEGTLARMRTEYVIPLQGKINARIDQLNDDITKAASKAHGKRLQKEQELLRKQQTELRHFDEKLRHCADQRIKLDLDDGVKVNYGKFGDLLACVTQVCGKGDDDE